MSLAALDHELITLITDYLPVRAVARLAMVCKLTHLAAKNNAQYAHMRKFKHVTRIINGIKHILYGPPDHLHGQYAHLYICGKFKTKYYTEGIEYGIDPSLHYDNGRKHIIIHDATIDNKINMTRHPSFCD